MDILHVSSIRCYGYHGVFAEEKRLGQWFNVDLSIGMDLSQAGETDALQHTVDYSAVVEQVKCLIQKECFDLIERLADAVANLVLSFEMVQTVRVKLSKLTAPIPDFDGNITIDILRKKIA